MFPNLTMAILGHGFSFMFMTFYRNQRQKGIKDTASKPKSYNINNIGFRGGAGNCKKAGWGNI